MTGANSELETNQICSLYVIGSSYFIHIHIFIVKTKIITEVGGIIELNIM